MAGAGDRPRTELFVVVGARRAREIDRAAHAIDDGGIARRAAGVEPKVVVVDDSGVAGGAGVAEKYEVIIDDGGAARRAAGDEIQVAVVGDSSVPGRKHEQRSAGDSALQAAKASGQASLTMAAS